MHYFVYKTTNTINGKRCEDVLSPEQESIRRLRISKVNRKPKKQTLNYSINAKKRKWLCSANGYVTHTTDVFDPRLTSDEWQLGRKWVQPGNF